MNEATPSRPKANRIEARKIEKRARIVQAAIALFAERGFHGTAVPLVASRAGVGAGTIYRFFDSKDALANAAFREAKGKLGQALLSELPTDGTARAMLSQLWTRLGAFALEQPTAFRFMELHDHTTYLDPESRELERRILAPLVALCARYQARGELRSDMRPDAMLAWCWGAFVGLVKAERLGYLALDGPTRAQARDACWRALAAPEPPSPSRGSLEQETAPR